MKSPSYDLCCVLHPQVLTKDSVTVAVDAVVYFRIHNATMSITNVENANRSTRLLAQTTLRNVLGTKNLSEILGDRETISETMQVKSVISIPSFQFQSRKRVYLSERTCGQSELCFALFIFLGSVVLTSLFQSFVYVTHEFYLLSHLGLQQQQPQSFIPY